MAGGIDIIRSIYQELFTVTLLHDGYGTPRPGVIGGDLRIEPDEETNFLFKNYDISYRFFTNTLVCFMRCADALPRVPFTPFTTPVRLRFFMHANSVFMTKTVVEPVGSQQLYQFSNQTNAATGGFISMNVAGVNNADLRTVTAVQPSKNCLGVIDIHNTGAVNPAYDLFTGINQTLQSPAYAIRFISNI